MKMKLLASIIAIGSSILATIALAQESKPLVIYKILGTVPVEMRDGDKFAVMLINEGGETAPSPRYVFAVADSRTVVDTKDIAIFRAALATLPKGTEIMKYGSCSAPRSWGLRQNHFKAYDKIFEDLGLKFSEELRLTCYCEHDKKKPAEQGARQPATAEGSRSEGSDTAKPESRRRSR
jgi:hypothetical protein